MMSLNIEQRKQTSKELKTNQSFHTTIFFGELNYSWMIKIYDIIVATN